MDFAAGAVVELVAPPPRAPARGGEDAADAATFESHLEAATDAEAPDADAKTDVVAAADSADPASAGEAAAAPAAPPTNLVLPIELQLIAPAAPVEASTATAPAPTPDAEASAKPAPAIGGAAPAPSAPEIEPTAQAPQRCATGEAPKGAEKEADKSSTAAAPSEATAPINAKLASAMPVAPTAVASVAASPTPPLAPQPASAAPPAIAAAPVIAAPLVAPVQQAAAPADARAPARPGKIDIASGDAKAEAPDARTDAQTPMRKPQAKAAPTVNNNGGVALAPAEASNAPTPNGAQPANTLALSTAHAAQTQHVVLEQNAVRAAPASAQVAREIVRRFDGESTRFELRLDPPELGRVEVRLEVSRDHRVTAIVSADSPQALSELARHARELEQTLQSAGLELADNGLSFDLRQSRENADETGGDKSARGDASGDVNDDAPLAARPIGLERWRGVRVDVTV